MFCVHTRAYKLAKVREEEPVSLQDWVHHITVEDRLFHPAVVRRGGRRGGGGVLVLPSLQGPSIPPLLHPLISPATKAWSPGHSSSQLPPVAPCWGLWEEARVPLYPLCSVPATPNMWAQIPSVRPGARLEQTLPTDGVGLSSTTFSFRSPASPLWPEWWLPCERQMCSHTTNVVLKSRKIPDHYIPAQQHWQCLHLVWYIMVFLPMTCLYEGCRLQY